MNRLLRVALGPVMLLLFALSVYMQYERYAHGSTLLARGFAVVGTLWVLTTGFIILCLIWQCIEMGPNVSFGLLRVVKWGLVIYFSTHGVAKLWLHMSAQSTGSLENFLWNGIYLVASVFLLVLIPTAYLFLIGALGLPRKSKAKSSESEKPLSVGKTKKFRALSGQLYEQTTTYHKKKTETSCVPVAG